MITDKKLTVLYKEQLVGTLAVADYRVAFEYADKLDELYRLGGTSGGALPTENALLRVGLQAGIGKAKCQQMIHEVQMCVNEMLGGYL